MHQVRPQVGSSLRKPSNDLSKLQISLLGQTESEEDLDLLETTKELTQKWQAFQNVPTAEKGAVYMFTSWLGNIGKRTMT